MKFYILSIFFVSTLNFCFCRNHYDYDNPEPNYSEEEYPTVVGVPSLRRASTNVHSAITFNSSRTPVKRKCYQTKVSYNLISFQYTWHIDQLLDYMTFNNKFNENLDIKSPEVRYEAFEGYWIFTLYYSGYREYRLRLKAEFTATYNSGRSRKPENIEILCNVVIDEKETPLPTQRISSTSYGFEWYNITGVVTNSSETTVNDATDFVFTINHYKPIDPKNKVDDRCSNDVSNANKKTIRRTSSGPPFTHNLSDLLGDEKYIDVIIKTKNTTDGIQAHRIILAKSSAVLEDLVYNSTYDKNESIIDMQDTENDIVEKFVRFIYTGQVNEVEETADRLIVLADTYAIPALKTLCEYALVRNIGLDNALKMYSLGMQVASQRITKRAFTIMKENKAKLASRSDEFRLLSLQYPNLMFELFVS